MGQLAGFSEAARKLALDRFHLLQSHLEDKRPLKAVAATAGIPYRTAQRWVALYQEFGFAGLARKKRTDTGENRTVSIKIKEAIEGIALQKPPLSVTAICRQVRRLAQDLGEEPPNYWAVYRIVSALPSDLITLAHHGSKVYSDTFELVHRREADGPNAIWQADHTPLDILLVRPDGQLLEHYGDRRPILYTLTVLARWRPTKYAHNSIECWRAPPLPELTGRAAFCALSSTVP